MFLILVNSRDGEIVVPVATVVLVRVVVMVVVIVFIVTIMAVITKEGLQGIQTATNLYYTNYGDTSLGTITLILCLILLYVLKFIGTSFVQKGVVAGKE